MSNMNGVPPPPPLALGAVPAVRLKAEISERRPEPPACVQNAMMTKDKKPFTYTPGGLDLSQIRSPRMAKRITRNANAEGVGAIPQSPNAVVERGPLPPSALAAMQTNMPVQVFPNAVPPSPPPPGPGGPVPPPPPPPPPSAKASSPPSQQNNLNNLPPYQRPDIKIPENPMGLLRKTGGPVHRPTGPFVAPGEELTRQPVMAYDDQTTMAQPPQQIAQPTMVQSPQPTMVQSPMQNSQPPVFKSVQPSQPIYKPVQPPTPQPTYQPIQPSSAEHKMESRAQIGTLYIPPLNQEELQQKTNQKADSPVTPTSPQDTLKKAPTPSWLVGRGQQQRQQEVPAWARTPPESAASSVPTTPATPVTPSTPGTPATPTIGTRIIPVRVEKSGDAFNQQQQNYQQQMQQQMLQQQQMYQQQMQQQQIQQQQMQQQQMQQQQMQQQQQQQYRQQQQYQQQTQQTRQEHIVRVIPIQIERSNSGPMSPNSNVGTPEVDGAPVQSPTFRILQRVTSRDEEIHSQPAIHHQPTVGQPFPVEQMRKMQLSNDDRNLMNRLKSQVDENTFLHDEEDPRYRGAAIPSRAFRMLQTMTDAAEASGDPTCVPRAVIVNRGPQQGGMKRNQAKTPDGQIDQSNLPPSQQTAPEPRKYTGSAIPSRSFQMLQAMVAPENCGPGQSDL